MGGGFEPALKGGLSGVFSGALFNLVGTGLEGIPTNTDPLLKAAIKLTAHSGAGCINARAIHLAPWMAKWPNE